MNLAIIFMTALTIVAAFVTIIGLKKIQRPQYAKVVLKRQKKRSSRQ